MLRVDKEEAVFAVFSPIDIPTCCQVEVVSEKNLVPSLKQKLKSAIQSVGRAVKKRSKNMSRRLKKKREDWEDLGHEEKGVEQCYGEPKKLQIRPQDKLIWKGCLSRASDVKRRTLIFIAFLLVLVVIFS